MHKDLCTKPLKALKNAAGRRRKGARRELNITLKNAKKGSQS